MDGNLKEESGEAPSPDSSEGAPTQLSALGSPSEPGGPPADVFGQGPPVSVSLHPLKVSFYEAVVKQLLDDELHEVAVALCGSLHVRANNLLPPDLLFTIFKAAAFQPAQGTEAAAAAVAAATQRLLLNNQAPSTKPPPGPPGEPDNTGGPLTPPLPEEAAAIPVDTDSPMEGPSGSGSGPEAFMSSLQQQQHQQQRQQQQWQPLRPRTVPPLTEGEQQLVFSPYPTGEGSGGPQGGPQGAPDTRGLEAHVSASIISSTSCKYSCISAACSADMSLVLGGALDGSVRLLEVKEQHGGPPSGGPSCGGPPTGRSPGKTRLLVNHEGPADAVDSVSAAAATPPSRSSTSAPPKQKPQGASWVSSTSSSRSSSSISKSSSSRTRNNDSSSGSDGSSSSSTPAQGTTAAAITELATARKSLLLPPATLRDVYPITAISPHPSGDFLYVGTTHPIVRLYDLKTLRAFASLRSPGAPGVPGAPVHQRGPLTDIRPSQDGSVLAAASEDGSIHLFDGVTGHLVNKLPDAHKFVLSAGLDGQTRIWDMRRGQQLLTFRTGERTDRRATSVFLQNEAFVASISGGELGGPLSLHSSFTGARVTSFVSPLPIPPDR
ncbi:hypothetical protein ACSSS7_004643 [Eimeria intestinalis]